MQLIQTRPNRGLPNGKVVFGLSTSHFRNLTWKWKQARQRDVSLWYHCDFWPSSLAQEAQSHLCPLLSVRSFTAIQMLHTHNDTFNVHIVFKKPAAIKIANPRIKIVKPHHNKDRWPIFVFFPFFFGIFIVVFLYFHLITVLEFIKMKMASK